MLDGIHASGCPAMPARSTICTRRCAATSITRRERANDSRADYFTPWRDTAQNSIANNCCSRVSWGSQRSFLPSARHVPSRSTRSTRANRVTKFFQSRIISVAPPKCGSTIPLQERIATRTNGATNSCKICWPENTRVCATASSDVPGASRRPRPAIDRSDRADYDHRMSMPPVLTVTASPRSRATKSEKRKRIASSNVLETIEQHILLDGFKVVIDLEKSRGSYLYDSASDRRLIDFYGFFGSVPVAFTLPYFYAP